MTPAEAFALAKHMLRQLARLSPGGRAYRERAAVLVDVLSYAGFEADAERLSMVLAGLYPPRHERVLADLEMVGTPIPPSFRKENLENTVDAIRREVLGPERRCGLTPGSLRAWLQTLLHRFARPEIDYATLNMHAQRIARILRDACAAGGNMLLALDAVGFILRHGNGLHLPVAALIARDNWFNYLDLDGLMVPTLALVFPRAFGKSSRFMLATYDALHAWSEGPRR